MKANNTILLISCLFQGTVFKCLYQILVLKLSQCLKYDRFSFFPFFFSAVGPTAEVAVHHDIYCSLADCLGVIVPCFRSTLCNTSYPL